MTTITAPASADTAETFAPFVIIPEHVLDTEVSNAAIRVYLSIRRYADNTTGQTWVGRERIAAHLGSARPATVDRYITELIDAGLITSQARWCSKLDKRDWALEKDADHTVQGSNLYTIVDIAAGQAGYAKADPLGTQKRTPWVRKSGHELDPFNQTHTPKDEEHSVDARANREADHIPEDFAPNKFHASAADRIGVDVNHLLAEFRGKMRDEKRTDWAGSFGKYVKAYGEGLEEKVFPPAADDVLPALPAIVESKPVVEAQDVTITRMTPVRPRPAGYPQNVEDTIRKVEKVVGHLTGPERILAISKIEDGVGFNVIAGDIDNERERTAMRSAA